MFGFLKRNKQCYFDDYGFASSYLRLKEVETDLKERLRKSELEKEKLELSKKYALKSLIDEDMTGYVKLGNKLLKVKVERAEKCWGPEGFDFKEIDLECIGEEYA